MSTSTDTGFDPNEVDDTGTDNENFRQMRAKANRTDAAEAAVAERDRRIAFLEAGLPSEKVDPRIGYFTKGYDGDLTPEAIQAAAIRDGFIAAPAGTQTDPAVIAAQQGQQAVAAVAGAAGVGPDDGLAQVRGLDQAFAEGGREGMLEYVRQQGYRITEYED